MAMAKRLTFLPAEGGVEPFDPPSRPARIGTNPFAGGSTIGVVKFRDRMAVAPGTPNVNNGQANRAGALSCGLGG